MKRYTVKNAQTQYSRLPVESKENTTQKRLRSEIVFGSLSTGCKGSGVCKVVPSRIEVKDWKCPHAAAWISLSPEGKIRIEFIKKSMTVQELRRYFRWQLFQVFEAYAMPAFVRNGLDTPGHLIIQPGIYAVKDTGKELIVDF